MWERMKTKMRRLVTAVLVAVFWLGVWALGACAANRSLLMPLPYPWDVAVSLWGLLGQGVFWADVGMSLLRILVGFSAAAVTGVVLAVLTTRFRLLDILFSPVLSVIRAVPVASFIFLAFLWIAADGMPTFIAFLMVVPLVWENVRQGIVTTDRKLLEMAQVFRLSRGQRLRRIWLPSVGPYLQAALSTGFGFAWKSGIAAEIICTTGRSIGAQIAAAKGTLDYARVFACTVVVAVLSVALERLLHRVIRREVAG